MRKKIKTGEQFFILESGTAEATDEGGKSLKSYTEKDYFGELKKVFTSTKFNLYMPNLTKIDHIVMFFS